MARARSRGAFTVLGRRLRVSGAPRAGAAWLQEVWPYPPGPAPSPPFTIRILLLSGPGLPALPPTACSRTTATNAPALEWWSRGGCWWTGTPRAGVRLRIRPGGARIALWGAAAGRRLDPLHGRLALHVALGEAMRASGLLPLHAAVATCGGRTVAFLGGSGAGKSTTLLRAVLAGWTPVAEDFSWLDPATLAIHATEAVLRLRDDAVARFAPELAAVVRACPTDAAGKRVLSRERLRAALPAEAAAAVAAAPDGAPRLDAIALLDRSGGGRAAAALEPLAPADAVRALWEAVGVPLLPASRQRTGAAIAGMLARLDTGRLRLDSTPSPLPATALQGAPA